MSTREQFAWIDNARSLSALAVVQIHIASSVATDLPDWHSDAWWVATFFNALARWCVPVFVMVSGALLLVPGKADEPLSTFYTKRASRILWPLLFWTAVFLVWNAAKQKAGGGHIDAGKLLRSAAMGRPHYHLWYLYMIVGLYLFTPFIRKLMQQLSASQTKAFAVLCLSLAMASLLFDTWRGPGRGTLFLTWFLPYVGYFVLGAIIAQAAPRVALGAPVSCTARTTPPAGPEAGAPAKPRYALLALGAAVAVVLAAVGHYLARRFSGMDAAMYFYDFLSVPIVGMSVCAFLLFRQMPAIPLLVKLAPVSFGIYLMHPLFIEGLSRLGFAAVQHNPLWSIPVLTLTVALISAGATWVLAKLPVGRKLV
jgi:surface polysaccharide O-acyltransferase-like enzyme